MDAICKECGYPLQGNEIVCFECGCSMEMVEIAKTKLKSLYNKLILGNLDDCVYVLSPIYPYTSKSLMREKINMEYRILLKISYNYGTNKM